MFSIKKIYYFILLCLVFLIHQYIFLKFIPNDGGLLGHDFEYFLPNFLFGKIWFENNFLSVPWFTPSFCCGIPFHSDPQTMYYSIQQIFYIFFEPILATKILFIYFSLISFVGMFLLLKKSFNYNFNISLLGATLFLFNGFFIYRFIIGHLGYVNFSLVPLFCFFFISSLKTRNNYLSKIYLISSAFVLSSCIYSGVSSFIFMITLSIFLILLIFNFKYQNFKSIIGNLLISFIISITISLSKISSAYFFLENFQRSYDPVYFESFTNYIYSTLRSIFIFPDIEHLNQFITKKISADINIHEIENGISIVPLFAFFISIFRLKKINIYKINFQYIIILLILCVPIILNVNLFSINQIWNSIPLLGSSWLHIRWNVLYIIPLILFSLAVFNNNKILRNNNYFTIIFISIIILQNVYYNKSYYNNQGYNPKNMIELSKLIKRKDNLSIVGIGVITDEKKEIIKNQRNDYFKLRLSSFYCYQPIFGYAIEKLPNKELKFNKSIKISDNQFLQVGDIKLENDEKNYNFLKPYCFLFPNENRCRPGERYNKNEEKELNNFLNYKKIKFKKNNFQKISDFVSMIIFIGTMLYLLINIMLFYKKRNF